MYIGVNLHSLIEESRSHYSYDAPEGYISRIKEQHDGPLLNNNLLSSSLIKMEDFTIYAIELEGFLLMGSFLYSFLKQQSH